MEKYEKQENEYAQELFAELPVTVHGGEVLTRGQKVLACGIFLATNDLNEVARQMGFSRRVVEGWLDTDWWDNALQVARAKEAEKLEHDLTQILNSTLLAIKDRVEGGDTVIGAEGEMVRVPAKLRDLNSVAQMALDKKLKVRDIQSSKLGDDKMLDRLAERLTKLGSVKPSIEGEVIGKTVGSPDHGTRESQPDVLVPHLHEGTPD